MKKVLVLLLVAAMIASMLTGCGSNQAPTTEPPKQETAGNEEGSEKETTFGLTPMKERTTLRVGFFSGSAHGMPFYIADKMGFFDELNIDVVYESFIAGPAMMEASASWDICDVGGPGVLNGMKNHDIRMIGVCDNEYNTAMFVRPDSDLAKDLKNPDLWKGKTIILTTGTTLQYMAANYLKSIGTSIENVNVIGMDVTSGLTAFLAGEGDAVCAWNAVAYNAEDRGLLRVTDIGQMNLNNVCGLCATPEALENKLELITKAWMVYYMTWEWCQASEENMNKAVELYVQSCEEEGVVSDESICRRALEIFECPSVSEAYALMTEKETDRSGSGQILKANNLLFETLDFFISLGNYTSADRQKILDMNLVDPVVAESAAETLKALNYIN
ncbi:MAG: ABC transporter substrate-binding protein [Sedimentibacter sp.]|nr:ABC transporter substrate-binding protein [Sedimentibacter sp.]